MILYDNINTLSTGTEETPISQYNPDTPLIVTTPTPTPTATPVPPHFIHDGKVIYYSGYPIPGTPSSPEEVSMYVTTALEIGYESSKQTKAGDEGAYETYLIAEKWSNSAIHAVAENDFSEEYVIAYDAASGKYLYGDCYEEREDMQELNEWYANRLAEGGKVYGLCRMLEV